MSGPRDVCAELWPKFQAWADLMRAPAANGRDRDEFADAWLLVHRAVSKKGGEGVVMGPA